MFECQLGQPLLHAGCYELSRQYRRKGDAKALKDLLSSAQEAGVQLKDDFVTDVQMWLEKRGL